MFVRTFVHRLLALKTKPLLLTKQRYRNKITSAALLSNLSGGKMSGEVQTHGMQQDILLEKSKRLAPNLNIKGNYKGASGKIAVVGGSFEYTGAPYFAAISALKLGADLVHVFCTREAAIPIKCYSPELIVHPLLQEDGFEAISDWLKRMDVVLIGCGLGRNIETLKLVEKIIACVKTLKKPLILDADALFLITQKPTLLIGFESNVILTPNRMELARLVGITNPTAVDDNDIAATIKRNNWDAYITLLVKAANDQVFNKAKKITFLDLGGSNRRCGGQGDILGGSLAVFLHWSLSKIEEDPVFVACYAACAFTRECNRHAYIAKGRSMTASDMIDQIHDVFEIHFEQLLHI